MRLPDCQQQDVHIRIVAGGGVQKDKAGGHTMYQAHHGQRYTLKYNYRVCIEWWNPLQPVYWQGGIANGVAYSFFSTWGFSI